MNHKHCFCKPFSNLGAKGVFCCQCPQSKMTNKRTITTSNWPAPKKIQPLQPVIIPPVWPQPYWWPHYPYFGNFQ